MCRRLKPSYLQVKSSFTHWPYVDTMALKAPSESTSCISDGKAFQSRTVLGKKDIFLLSDLQPLVWNMFLVFRFGKINLLTFFMATNLLSTLYSMQRRASYILTCRDRQFKPWSMSLTLDLFRCLLVTYSVQPVAVPSQASGCFCGYADPILYLHIPREV